MSEPATRQSAGWSLGPALILFGILTWILASDIPHASLGNNQDPGPRAFPVALAILLILGGASELGRTLLPGRRKKRSPQQRSPILRHAWTTLTRRENLNAWILVGALTLYLVFMPWIGFSVATLAFSTGMMRRLGAPWKLAAPVSVGLVAAIYVLFTVLFKVQLPAGVLGLSW